MSPDSHLRRLPMYTILVRFIRSDLTYYRLTGMKLMRCTSTLAVLGLILLALIGSSFVTCMITAESDCCEDDHECDDPVCADGAICHCACAFSGVLPKVEVPTMIPLLAGEMTADPVIPFVPHFSSDLFRPPRTV